MSWLQTPGQAFDRRGSHQLRFRVIYEIFIESKDDSCCLVIQESSGRIQSSIQIGWRRKNVISKARIALNGKQLVASQDFLFLLSYVISSLVTLQPQTSSSLSFIPTKVTLGKELHVTSSFLRFPLFDLNNLRLFLKKGEKITHIFSPESHFTTWNKKEREGQVFANSYWMQLYETKTKKTSIWKEEQEVHTMKWV